MHGEVLRTLHIRFLLLLTLSLLKDVLISGRAHLGEARFSVVFYKFPYLSDVPFRHTFSGAVFLSYLHWVIILIVRYLFWNLGSIINIKDIVIFTCCKIFISLILFFILLTSSYYITDFFPNLFCHFPHIGFRHIAISK